MSSLDLPIVFAATLALAGPARAQPADDAAPESASQPNAAPVPEPETVSAAATESASPAQPNTAPEAEPAAATEDAAGIRDAPLRPAPDPETLQRVLDPTPRPVSPGPPLTGKREVPDYDGRGEEPTSAAEGAAWVPRIILFPVWVVTEYVVRWPLGTAAKAVERYHVIEYAKEIFTFRDGTIGAFPTLNLDRGITPMVGIYSYADGLIHPAHYMRLNASTSFAKDHAAVFLNRFELIEDELNLNLRLSLEQRNDFVYFGTGWQTRARDESRFGRRKLMAVAELALRDEEPGFDGWISFEVSDNDFACVRDSEFNICGEDDLPGTGDDLHRIDAPDDVAFFTSGYHLLRLKARGSLDTRRPRPAPGTGARLEVFGRWGKGIQDGYDNIHFMRYGVEGSLFWDLSHDAQRVLGLRLMAEWLEPLDNGDVPFAELITLGGMESMRGFLHARFHGRSGVTATLEYRYPVWSFLDSNIFFEVGNAFGPRFEDFELERLRGSAGIALRTNTSRDLSFDILFALGSNRFDADELRVEFFRFALGTNLGF